MMGLDLLLGFARRYAAPLILAAIVAATLAGIVYGTAAGIKKVYKAGYEAGAEHAQSELDKARAEADTLRAEHQARLDMVAAAHETQRREAARRFAAERARAQAAEARLNDAIQANPSFAAVERPADLRRVRIDDFTQLIEAAKRSAELSADGLPGLPATGDRTGSDPRGLGASRPGKPDPLAGVHQPTQ